MTAKKIKFNFVDVIILVVVLAVAFFAGSKIFGKNEEVTTPGVTATLTFYCEEVPEYVSDLIKTGDTVSDEAKNVDLGKIISVNSKNALTYGWDAQGNSVTSEKKGYKSLEITTEVTASEFAHGIIAGDVKYSVGHSLTLYAGKTKLSAKISGLQVK